MTKRILFLIRGLPRTGALANEALDLLLVAAAFDLRPSVLFMGEAVFQLLPPGDAGLDGVRDVARAWSALPAYDVDRIYAAAESVARFGLDTARFTVPVQCIDADAISALIATHDVVLSG
jgi:tRNA 2-thiouridine synthesizing protein C